MVVVGAGLGGARCCQELRARGFQGRLLLLGDEGRPPYDRPPLSKGARPADSSLPIDLDELAVDFRPGAAAWALRGASVAGDSPLVVTTAAGDQRADAVVVATGAVPVVPPGWELGDRVRVLRTAADAEAWWRLVAELGEGARVALLGGSWIGLEMASVLAAAGVSVVVVERASWLLPALPPELGRQVRRWCDDAGVEVRLGMTVESVRTGAGGVTVAARPAAPGALVETVSETFAVDAALICAGARPATDWLADAGLPLTTARGALRVDSRLRSADRRVVGVGDAVERWAPRYRTWLPGGHWQDAMDEPGVAADSVLATLAGGAAGPVYDAVPYFWSEMFGRTLQWTGHVRDQAEARMISRGRVTDPAWSVCWLDDDDRLLGLLACDRPRDAVAARKAQAAATGPGPVADPVALADPDVPVRSCLLPEGGGG